MEERFVELEKKKTETLARGGHAKEETASTDKCCAAIVKARR